VIWNPAGSLARQRGVSRAKTATTGPSHADTGKNGNELGVRLFHAREGGALTVIASVLRDHGRS
jgi:hypothetical protein